MVDGMQHIRRSALRFLRPTLADDREHVEDIYQGRATWMGVSCTHLQLRGHGYDCTGEGLWQRHRLCDWHGIAVVILFAYTCIW